MVSFKRSKFEQPVEAMVKGVDGPIDELNKLRENHEAVELAYQRERMAMLAMHDIDGPGVLRPRESNEHSAQAQHDAEAIIVHIVDSVTSTDQLDSDSRS